MFSLIGLQPNKGQIFAESPPLLVRMVNRTGGTLSWGDLLATNLAFAATAGQAMVGLTPGIDSDDAAGYVLGAAITPTTEANARVMVVCQDPSVKSGGTIADNAEFLAAIQGIVQVNMNGANAGEFIHGTDGQKYATPLTLTELASASAVLGIIGVALEASSGAQVKKAIFNGLAFSNLLGV